MRGKPLSWLTCNKKTNSSTTLSCSKSPPPCCTICPNVPISLSSAYGAEKFIEKNPNEPLTNAKLQKNRPPIVTTTSAPGVTSGALTNNLFLVDDGSFELPCCEVCADNTKVEMSYDSSKLSGVNCCGTGKSCCRWCPSHGLCNFLESDTSFLNLW